MTLNTAIMTTPPRSADHDETVAMPPRGSLQRRPPKAISAQRLAQKASNILVFLAGIVSKGRIEENGNNGRKKKEKMRTENLAGGRFQRPPANEPLIHHH